MSGLLAEHFLLICCAVLYSCSKTNADETCKALQLVKSTVNKNLIGHDILETEESSVQECAKKCFKYKKCKAFGFRQNGRSCKLKDTDSKAVGETGFETSAGAIFSDISAWPSRMAGYCAQRPCSEYQICSESNDGYQCIDTTCDGVSVPTIEYGVLTPNSLNTNATVTCDDGYETLNPVINCNASGNWEEGASCVEKADTDCKDILANNPSATSGIYTVQLWKARLNLTVYCDMTLLGGGWTVIHNRFNGIVEFYRVFSEYDNGFGNLNGEFWLGLKYIQEIADQGATEFRLEVTRNNGDQGFESYQEFQLLDGTDYKLSINTASAVRSPTMSPDYNFAFTNGQPFTSYDNVTDFGCAAERHAAWWFAMCTYANLNGWYCEPGTYCADGNWGLSGHHHKGFGTADTESLLSSRMLIRRV